MNNNERNRIINHFKLSPADQKRIITWDLAKERLMGTRNDIVIDNADIFLET